MMEYNYLVKKVVFKISILPNCEGIIRIVCTCVFVVFALIICSFNGYTPTLHTLQIFYYTGCTFVFVLALVYATSAIVAFFRDLTQIIKYLSSGRDLDDPYYVGYK